MQPRACHANRRRSSAPVDSEEGLPGSAASRTASSASFGPTAARTAGHFANSPGSHLVTPGASKPRFRLWARQTTPRVTSARRIAARLLQRTGDTSAATVVATYFCSAEQIRETNEWGRARWGSPSNVRAANRHRAAATRAVDPLKRPGAAERGGLERGGSAHPPPEGAMPFKYWRF